MSGIVLAILFFWGLWYLLPPVLWWLMLILMLGLVFGQMAREAAQERRQAQQQNTNPHSPPTESRVRRYGAEPQAPLGRRKKGDG